MLGASKHPNSQVEDVFNAVAVEAEGLGTSLSYGRGLLVQPVQQCQIFSTLPTIVGQAF